MTIPSAGVLFFSALPVDPWIGYTNKAHPLPPNSSFTTIISLHVMCTTFSAACNLFSFRR